MTLRTASTSGLLFALGALGYHFAEPRLTEHDVRTRVERLRAGAHIEAPASEYQPPPVASLVFFRRLEGLDVWLERRAPSRAGLGAPWRWQPSEAERLAEELQPLATFFHEIKRILDEPACREALGEGARLARLAPLFEATAEELLVDTPKLAAARNWSNLLCARAVVAARRPETREEAPRRLGQALDLAHLIDDGTYYGLFIRTMGTDITLLALQTLLAEGVDASLLRSALDERLARAVRPEACELAFASEVDRAVRVWEAASEGGVDLTGYPIPATPALRIQLERYEAHLAGARPLCDEVELADLSGTARTWKSLELNVLQARLALAAADYRARFGRDVATLEELGEMFPEGLPSPACDHVQVALEPGPTGPRLFFRDGERSSEACLPARQIDVWTLGRPGRLSQRP